MHDRELNILNERFQSLQGKNKPFGGFSVIYAGDFDSSNQMVQSQGI